MQRNLTEICLGIKRQREVKTNSHVPFTSNLLAGCSGTAVGLSSSVMPSLVSLCVTSSWLKLRPITRRSSNSAALLSLVSLHTLFSRLRDFRMDFLGMSSPFFTSTNNLTKTTVLIIRCLNCNMTKFSPSEIHNFLLDCFYL